MITSSTPRYRPGTSLEWRGRSDGVPNSFRYHEVIRHLDLREEQIPEEKGNLFAFLGFCCDEGVRRNQGRPGAAEGPRELRHSISQFPIPATPSVFFDVGDVTCEDENLEETQQVAGGIVAQILREGACPVILGGGHEVAWAHYLGIEGAGKHEDVAILNFDAHFDLRPLKEGRGNSGTPFMQIANRRQEQGLPFDYTCIGIQRLGNTSSLFDSADRLGVTTVFADRLHDCSDTCEGVIDELLSRSEHVMLSICMDVFAAAFGPGVSAPQPLGLLPWQVLPLVERVAASGKVVGVHIAEVSPPLDHLAMTSRLAASLVAGFIDGAARA